MPITGTPAFDAIAILDIGPINFHEQGAPIQAQAAYIDTKTGATYGRIDWSNWSKDTLDKLMELRACMEVDIATRVFIGGGAATSGRANLALNPPEESDGIGEHAGIRPEADQA